MDAIVGIAGLGIAEKLEKLDTTHTDVDGTYTGRMLCGNPLGYSVGLLITAGLQTWDSFSDIAVTLAFAYSGDWYWFLAGFSIQVVCGCTVGLMHAHCSRVRHGDGGGRTSLQAHSSMSQKAILAHTSKHTDVNKWTTWTIAPVLGMLGLIPATVCVLALKETGYVDTKKRVQTVSKVQRYDAHAEEVAEAAQENVHLVYLQSALELVLESMPQAVLQTYIGVAYGELDQETTSMSKPVSMLLAFSILCSFVASGAVMFDLESEERNQELPSSHHLQMASLYGFVTIVGRAGQVASLVFINALWACAFKAMALPSVILAVAMLYSLTMYSKIQCKGFRKASPNIVEATQYAVHTVYVLVLLMLFYLLRHEDNDYGSIPDGSDSPAPQSFDCRQRHSSIAVLVFSLTLSVVFMVASLLLDPQWGCRADGSIRHQMELARAEEDARAELRVARAWIAASISELQDVEWQLEDSSVVEVDLQDNTWVIREYRKQMIESIGKQVERACELHCKQTGQPCNREAQWKFRQHRKLRWESPSYFLFAEYAAWADSESRTESNLHNQHVVHKERTQHSMDEDDIRDLVDEYQSLFESFLLQAYAHPRCYKWEEQALWEASEKVAELEEQLSFTTMYKLAPPASRCWRRSWIKRIVRLVGEPQVKEAGVGAAISTTEDTHVATGKPNGCGTGAKLECFEIEAFNLANHRDKLALQPVEELSLSDVTHCRDPHLNPYESKHARHAIELVSPTQVWTLAAESVKDKRRWLKKLSILLPSHTAMDEALADLDSETTRRRLHSKHPFKQPLQPKLLRRLPKGEPTVTQLETGNPTFESEDPDARLMQPPVRE